eukprot:TRINITY_DN536_c0_g1_i1.p1 TRINITY_DN536_c0_g1~~TRINITY_DN536_c0_g1_i1.p1  ORF type:complete len:113 (-),score=11.25 TRINITY_DN536_c0_g1_i1:48-386(-)
MSINYPQRVKCQAIPHPSIHAVEPLLGGDAAALCKKVMCPTLLIPGGNDPDTYRTGGACMNAFVENNPASKSTDHMFDGVAHGWVTRSNNENDFPLVTKAVGLVVDYIKSHL